MKVTDEIYVLQLTSVEIETITNALHACYKDMKETRQENQDEDDSSKTYARMRSLRELRNEFGHLIDRSFMGVDA